MKIQIIEDSQGKATGVYIPIKEWKELKKQYKDLEELESPKDRLLQELKEASEQIRLHKQGKIKLKTAQELLDEL